MHRVVVVRLKLPIVLALFIVTHILRILVNKGVEQSVVIHFLHEIFALAGWFFYYRAQRSSLSPGNVYFAWIYIQNVSCTSRPWKWRRNNKTVHIIFTHFSAARWTQRRTKTWWHDTFKNSTSYSNCSFISKITRTDAAFGGLCHASGGGLLASLETSSPQKVNHTNREISVRFRKFFVEFLGNFMTKIYFCFRFPSVDYACKVSSLQVKGFRKYPCAQTDRHTNYFSFIDLTLYFLSVLKYLFIFANSFYSFKARWLTILHLFRNCVM